VQFPLSNRGQEFATVTNQTFKVLKTLKVYLHNSKLFSNTMFRGAKAIIDARFHLFRK
jgi:hypothetical protein